MDEPLQDPTPVQGEAGPPTADRTDNLAARPRHALPLQGGPGRRGAEKPNERSRPACTRGGQGPGPRAPGEGAAVRCPGTRPPLPWPVPGAARVSAVTSPHPAPKYESAAAQPTRRKGGGRGRAAPGWREEGSGPFFPPAWLGRVCPPRPGQPGPLGEARARPQRHGRRPYSAIRGRGTRRGEAQRGKPLGRASRAVRRPMLLGRKAAAALAPAPRAQRPLLMRPQHCTETPPAATAKPTAKPWAARVWSAEITS